MKRHKRIIQACVVIIVVGIGWVHNLDKNSFLYQHISPVTADWKNDLLKTDSLPGSENKLFVFTKNIINSGIEHLILNL